MSVLSRMQGRRELDQTRGPIVDPSLRALHGRVVAVNHRPTDRSMANRDHERRRAKD